jgi:hypothetical protein
VPTNALAQKFIRGQIVGDHLTIGEFGYAAAAVDKDDLLIERVGLGVLDDAQERRQPGAGSH